MMNLESKISYIDNQVKNVQFEFFDKWDHEVRKRFKLEGNFTMRNFIDICGGFVIGERELQQMDKVLSEFFHSRVTVSDGRYYLRGYDYYFIDSLMHLSKNRKSFKKILLNYTRKWENYRIKSFESFRNEEVSFANWVGYLAYLEYLFSDFTTIEWFMLEYANLNDRKALKCFDDIKEYTDSVAHCMATLLRFDFENACIIYENIFSYICNINIDEIIAMCNFDEAASLRSIREGDSIALIYSSYLLKLLPYVKRHRPKSMILISNAFGAMNIGLIMKYLLEYDADISCITCNIHYAQGRAIEDKVYSCSNTNKCSLLDDIDFKQIRPSSILIIDDSVFTGKSYFGICDYLWSINIGSECDIKLLPMTINTDCLRYCRRGIEKEENVYEIVSKVNEIAYSVGDSYPAFVSFWDFARNAKENRVTVDNDEVNSVLGGDDLLMKHLWYLYADDIVSENCN